MNTSPFDSVLFLVYFVYGLAFLSLGIALVVESGRTPTLANAQVLRPLAMFGLLHGMHEWLEAYLMEADVFHAILPAWLPWFRLVLLVVSFVFLLIYAFQAFRLRPQKLYVGGYLLLIALGVYILFILGNAINAVISSEVGLYDLLNVLARYLLAVPGGIVAAFGLRSQALNSTGEERSHLLTHLSLASIGFGIYGLAQIFVSKVDMFPATYINATSFRVWAGFPIQAIRAAAAILVALGVVRATQLVERERQRLAAAAQKAHLEALEQRENFRHELLFHTVRAQEEERTRIAREIHDETAQLLTALSLNLATLRNYTFIVPETTPLVDRLQTLCKQMSQGLYRLVHDLRPAQLDDLGLIPAIQYLKDSNAAEGLEVNLEVQGQTRRLDSIVETVLFRVVQEALNNTLRHGQTNHAKVQVFFHNAEIILKVIDTGTGFDPEKPLIPPHGWGLAGMRERVELIGGRLSIESGQGKGTTVEVVVPEISGSATTGGGV